jgi:transcriptional regulator with XRE-family HTH domain
MSPTPQQIGNRISKRRKALDVSQYELARRTGLSRQYLRKLEEGSHDPTVGTLEKIADALKVSLTSLLRAPRRQG